MLSVRVLNPLLPILLLLSLPLWSTCAIAMAVLGGGDCLTNLDCGIPSPGFETVCLNVHSTESKEPLFLVAVRLPGNKRLSSVSIWSAAS